MSRRFTTFVLSVLATLGLCLTAGAQGTPQCPSSCPATFSVQASGQLVVGDMVLVTPMTVQSGQGAELFPTGGGAPVCSTCKICGARFVLSWTINGNKCLSYNNCGLLQTGPGSGSQAGALTRNCGKSTSVLIDYGTCNPLYVTACPPYPVLPVEYTQTWTLDCGTCQ